MQRYLYVEVREMGTANGESPSVSFDSVIVQADDEDSAYEKGQVELLNSRVARISHLSTQVPPTSYEMTNLLEHSAGVFLNDYVVSIPDPQVWGDGSERG